MSEIRVKDGAQVFYRDWGTGQPVVFSHGWPLNSDCWEAQMLFLAGRGLRCIAHDRRGHGRSAQTWHGNDMDTYADDLNTLIERLGLRAVTLIGFGAGGAEVTRYIGRHGTRRVARAVLVSTVTPHLLQDDTNPAGVPAGVFDALRADMTADRSQLYQDLAATTYFGGNRPGSAVTAGMRDAFWLQGITAGLRNALEGITAFSATDFRGDLPLFDIPALVIHGDDDQLAPLNISSQASAALIPGAVLKVYAGAPHGLTETHKQQLSEDLLQFIVS